MENERTTGQPQANMGQHRIVRHGAVVKDIEDQDSNFDAKMMALIGKRDRLKVR